MTWLTTTEAHAAIFIQGVLNITLLWRLWRRVDKHVNGRDHDQNH